jgi:hypothetical protein
MSDLPVPCSSTDLYPLTGRERRRWHPAGPDRAQAQLLAGRLAAEAATQRRDPGLSLARYLRERWLPSKQVRVA